MNKYHDSLKNKMDNFVHLVFRATKLFPREELFCTTSQLRRSALSVVLNYIEGFARQKNKVYKNFLEVSYASLKEAEYLLNFSFKEKYLNEEDYKKLKILADEIGGMLWGILSKI